MTPARVMAGLVMVGDCEIWPAAVLDGSGASALARPKSSTFTVPSGLSFDVGGLQIAVDDTSIVRRFQRLGDLSGDWQGLVERDWSLRDAVGQRRPFDQLQDERPLVASGFSGTFLQTVD